MREDIKISLINYITGQADETESAEVREWIRSKPENEQYYFELYEAWHSSLYAERDIVDVESAYALFRAKASARTPIYKRLRFLPKLAAAALVLFACAIAVYDFISTKPPETLIELSIPKGLTKKLVLPDGSTVWVNAESQITYSKDFGKTDRDVFLVGEAYFDIAKTDTEIPFLVKTDKFTIRDVGTVFNVKAYPDDEVFETTVVEGKVSVEGKLTQGSDLESKVFLDANQVLKINTDENKPSGNKAGIQAAEPVKVMQIADSQIEQYNGWKDDFLIFQGDTFEDITKILERRYDVEIVFGDEELKSYQYTGTFKNIENISTVFEVIKENTPIDYNTEGKRITILKANRPININLKKRR